jgi:sulfur-oxidizing protein SoxZ
MTENVKPRVKVPATAKAGEIVEIKTLITHPMESGQRRDAEGKVIPRKIINAFRVTYNGNEVFSAKLGPSVSTNPYLSFFVRADKSGPIEFTWIDDDGSVYKETATIKVE